MATTATVWTWDDRIELTGNGRRAKREDAPAPTLSLLEGGATPAPNAPMEPEEPQAFAICDERSANWLLRKLANIEAERSRVKAQCEAILRQLDGDKESLLHLYGRQLEAWAEEELRERGGRRKSIALLQGTVGFRTVPGGVRVTDARAALAYALESLPDAVKSVPTLDADAYRAHSEATGEALPGTEVVAPSERFYTQFREAKRP